MKDIVSYVWPFEYIRDKCSECSKTERCMISVTQRLRCLGPVSIRCVTSQMLRKPDIRNATSTVAEQ